MGRSDDMAAMEKAVRRWVRDEINQSVDRVMVVQSVNVDGTVNLDAGDGSTVGAQALASYVSRAPGDVVFVRVRAGQYWVLGPAGPAPTMAAPWVPVLSDAAPPAGQGWDPVVTGSVWQRLTPPYQWGKRVTAAPPVTGGSVTAVGTAYLTYLAGVPSQQGIAEQGNGQTGLVTFGAGAWSGLTGQTCTGATLTVHRDADFHGQPGRTPLMIWQAAAATPPATPPALLPGPSFLNLALNETSTIGLDSVWAQAFATGAASALAFFTNDPAADVQVDLVTLTVTYS